MQEVVVNLGGLYTNSTKYTKPTGALLQANNVVQDAVSVLSSRRGFTVYSEIAKISGTEKIIFMSSYEGRLLLFTGERILLEDAIGSATFTAIDPTYALADDTIGTRLLKIDSGIVYTSEDGVQRLENGVIDMAGEKLAIDMTITTVATGVLAEDNQYAYRCIWGRFNAANFLRLGVPSERAIVRVPAGGGTLKPTLRVRIPEGVTTSYFVQLYRSIGSGGEDDEPDDELKLIYEGNPTALDITNGYMDIDDIIPESLLGATIYTASTQEGIQNGNFPPPFAKDIGEYKGMATYANSRQYHSFKIALTGVDATGVNLLALNNNDYISIGGIDMTAKNVALNPDEFEISNSGDPVADIRITAQNLIAAFNAYTTNTDYYAYYSSGYADLPGQITFISRTLDNTAFSVNINKDTCWTPSILNNTSVADVKPNRVYFSKYGLPEAVPLYRYLDYGVSDSAIIRAIGLKDAFFVFTEDGKVYRTVGETFENLTIDLIDNNTYLISPKSAVVFENSIYCFTEQGIVSYSESGDRLISYPIENVIKSWVSRDITPDFPKDSFGLSYDSDRKYLLFDGDEFNYVYNSLPQTFTAWTLPATSACINTEDDKMYYASVRTANLVIHQERKSFTLYDHADDDYDCDITAIGPELLNITLDPMTFTLTIEHIGWTLRQGDKLSVITAVDTGTNTATVDLPTELVVGDPTTINEPIACDIILSDTFGQAPAILKNYREVLVGFEDMNKAFTVTFYNNFNTMSVSQEVQPRGIGSGWGLFPWGGVPWGGLASGLSENRILFPIRLKKALSCKIGVRTSVAFTKFTLDQITLTFDGMSEVFARRRGA